MGTETKIEWTDHTLNPWRGCSKVAEGCKFCYADAQAKRNPGTLGIWGPNGTRVVASESMWREPVKWNAKAAANEQYHAAYRSYDPHRPRVFCASMADVFEEWDKPLLRHDGCSMWRCAECGEWRDGALPEVQTVAPWCYQHTACKPLMLSDVRARLFSLIDATPNLDWQLLTKRPENIPAMWPIEPAGYSESPIPTLPPVPVHERKFRENVWLGTSIACQADADRNVPLLLKCRDLASVLFLSLEPLIGPVDLERIEAPPSMQRSVNGGLAANSLRSDDRRFFEFDSRVDWVIVGGESGPNARPCDIAWIRDIVRQCKAAGVKCFVKQLGDKAFTTEQPSDRDRQFPVSGKWNDGMFRPALSKKGGDWEQWPADLRVREFPDVQP